MEGSWKGCGAPHCRCKDECDKCPLQVVPFWSGTAVLQNGKISNNLKQSSALFCLEKKRSVIGVSTKQWRLYLAPVIATPTVHPFERRKAECDQDR